MAESKHLLSITTSLDEFLVVIYDKLLKLLAHFLSVALKLVEFGLKLLEIHHLTKSLAQLLVRDAVLVVLDAFKEH